MNPTEQAQEPQQQQQPQTIDINVLFATIGKKTFELDQTQQEINRLNSILNSFNNELKTVTENNKWISKENEELKRVIAKLKKDYDVQDTTELAPAVPPAAVDQATQVVDVPAVPDMLQPIEHQQV